MKFNDNYILFVAILTLSSPLLAQSNNGLPDSEFIRARDNSAAPASPDAAADNAQQQRQQLSEIISNATGEDVTADANVRQAQLPPEAILVDRIVAVAEEDVILESELQQSIDGVRNQIRTRGGAMPPEDLLREQVLERMILNKLQVQRALSTGIRVSDSDVDQALAGVAQQNNIDILTLRQTLERDGFDFADFRNELRDELIITRLRERVGSSVGEITDTEIEILLSSDQFGGAEYNLSHILIGVPDGATPDQVSAAQERVRDVYERLQNGLEFSAAAISYSDAQDALDGGIIGWRNSSTMPNVFASSIEKLEPGEFSEPVRSPVGYHILRLTDRRDQTEIVIQEKKVRHLMVATNELMDTETARQHMMEMKTEIEAGADFGEMAREHSDDNLSANLGGDLGWIQPAQYGPRFQQILSSLSMHQMSEPFQDESGWHIIMLEDERESDVTDLALRNRARQTIQQQKAEQEFSRFVRQLRDEAYVDIRI